MGGAKRGLGATKIQTNFEDIEREAHMADSLRSLKAQETKTEDVESQVSLFGFFILFYISNGVYSLFLFSFQASSLRLAYQDLSLETKKQSEKLNKVDPSKAQQLERLGMGIMSSTSGSRYFIVSHSILPTSCCTRSLQVFSLLFKLLI